MNNSRNSNGSKSKKTVDGTNSSGRKRKKAIANNKENEGSKSAENTLLTGESILGAELNEIKGMWSTGKKRSLYVPEGDDSIGDVEYDLEHEKEERRQEERAKEEEKKKRTSKKPYFNILTLSPEELEAHVSKCMKMVNANKVNPKNAFHFQIIDYMAICIAKNPKKAGNLTFMSRNLSASAKVYSNRVDKVYMDMTSIFSKKAQKNENSGDEDSEDNDDENNLKKKKKEVINQLTRRNCSSEDEEEDVTVNSEKVLQAHDSFDRGPLEKEYYGVALPRNTEFFILCPLGGDHLELTMGGSLMQASEIPTSTNNSVNLGSKFNGSFETEDFGRLLPRYELLRSSYCVMDEMDLGESTGDPELLYDCNAPPTVNNSARKESSSFEDLIEVNDVDYDDVFEDADVNEAGYVQGIEVQKPSFTVEGMSRLVAPAANDYSFFDNTKLCFWAGPKHWKLRQPRKQGGEKKTDHPKTERKEALLKFGISEFKKSIELFKSDIHQATQLSDRTLAGWKNSSYQVHPKMPQLVSLITRLFKCQAMSAVGKGSTAASIRKSLHESFANFSLTPEDILNHSGQRSNNEDDDDDDLDLDQGMNDDHDFNNDQDNLMVDPLNPSGISEMREDLLPMPPKVNKVSINYAKIQKKIDVKLVKDTMWKTMNLKKQDQDGKDKEYESGGQSEARFSEVFKSVKKTLPAEASSELSVATAFMSLLHMANEKNLCLKGNKDLSDVTITLDSPPR